MEVTILLSWIGCLIRYLASPNQQMLRSSLTPEAGWAGFVLLNGLAFVMLNTTFGTAVSMVTLLALWMVNWISIVLINGHASLKRLPYLLIALLSVSYILRMG